MTYHSLPALKGEDCEHHVVLLIRLITHALLTVRHVWRKMVKDHLLGPWKLTTRTPVIPSSTLGYQDHPNLLQRLELWGDIPLNSL